MSQLIARAGPTRKQTSREEGGREGKKNPRAASVGHPAGKTCSRCVKAQSIVGFYGGLFYKKAFIDVDTVAANGRNFSCSSNLPCLCPWLGSINMPENGTLSPLWTCGSNDTILGSIFHVEKTSTRRPQGSVWPWLLCRPTATFPKRVIRCRQRYQKNLAFWDQIVNR